MIRIFVFQIHARTKVIVKHMDSPSNATVPLALREIIAQQKILAARIHVTMGATVSATVKLIMSVNVEKDTLE